MAFFLCTTAEKRERLLSIKHNKHCCPAASCYSCKMIIIFNTAITHSRARPALWLTLRTAALSDVGCARPHCCLALGRARSAIPFLSLALCRHPADRACGIPADHSRCPAARRDGFAARFVQSHRKKNKLTFATDIDVGSK